MHPDWYWHLAGGLLVWLGSFLICYAIIAHTFERGISLPVWLERCRRREP